MCIVLEIVLHRMVKKSWYSWSYPIWLNEDVKIVYVKRLQYVSKNKNGKQVIQNFIEFHLQQSQTVQKQYKFNLLTY